MGAVYLMLQFATMDREKYDEVMKALDWRKAGSPKGLISHMAVRWRKAGASWMCGNRAPTSITSCRRLCGTHSPGSVPACRKRN